MHDMIDIVQYINNKYIILNFHIRNIRKMWF